MSRPQIIITSNDFYDDAKDFQNALETDNAFVIDDPNYNYDNYADGGAIYIVRSATAGCAYFDAEGSFSDNLLQYLNKVVHTKRTIGFVLCYPENGERPQRSLKKLISNQSELHHLSQYRNVFFLEHVIHKQTWSWSLTLKHQPKWERKNGLVRMWPDFKPTYTSIHVRIEGLPASSGRLKWRMAHDNGGNSHIGDIQYEKSGKDPVKARDVTHDWRIYEAKRGGHYIDFDVYIDNDKKYTSVQFLFSAGSWQAESEFLELKHESKAEKDARRVNEIINSLGADSAQIAKELKSVLASVKKFNRPDIGSLVQEILDAENHEQILTELETSEEEIVPMEN